MKLKVIKNKYLLFINKYLLCLQYNLKLHNHGN